MQPTPCRALSVLLISFAALCRLCNAQPPSTSPLASQSEQTAPSGVRLLPEITALMRDVEANQRRFEATEKDYIYHAVTTGQEQASDGRIKKTRSSESDNFWVSGVPVRRMTKVDGKPLSAEEIAKENERIDKVVAKAIERRNKADAKNKGTDGGANGMVSVSRLLELGAFTSPRRVQLNGRDTIAVDFTGDPKAKTRNPFEEVIRDLAGTAWIDEQDHVLSRVEGHFAKSFKVAGGLMVSVQKDTRFSTEQQKINDEVWLPSRFEGQGSIHALLFFGFTGTLQVVDSDYKKFRATSKILPGAALEGPPGLQDPPSTQ